MLFSADKSRIGLGRRKGTKMVWRDGVRQGDDEEVTGLVKVESMYNVPRRQRISECKCPTAYPCDFVCGGRGG